MSDPLRRPGQTLKKVSLFIFFSVILYNLGVAIMRPYFPLIAQVVSGAVIVLVVGGVIAILINIFGGPGGGLRRGGIRRGR